MLTAGEIAADFKVTPQTIGKWHRRGLITGRRTDGRGECLFHPGQHRPGPADKTAARRPEATRHLLTGRQLAARLGVTSGTILRWTQLGLLTIAATDNRGFNLYQPGQPRPTRDQITTACRPPGTGDAITGGQLAARHGVSRSAVYKWHQLGLILSLGTDGTGRNLYDPAQQAPSPGQIPAVPHAATAPQNVRPQCHHQFQKAKHPRSPHPEPDHQHEVQCEARSFVTPVRTAQTIWFSHRETVLARLSSSGMSSLPAHQS